MQKKNRWRLMGATALCPCMGMYTNNVYWYAYAYVYVYVYVYVHVYVYV